MLESFLREYQERRRLRSQRQPSASSSVYGGDTGARGAGTRGYFDAAPQSVGSQGPPAKRQRLAEAAKLEDER